jgi:NADH-quinone oxidoreductase subunit G
MVERNGTAQVVPSQEAVKRLAALLSGGGRVIGIGSPRASLEANFALRQMVGPEFFFAGISPDQDRMLRLILDVLRAGPARSPSLREVELSDAVLILGEDVMSVAPRMALALRQSVRQQPMRIADTMRIPLWLDAAVREAVQDAKGPLFIAATASTRLDDIATETYRGAPDDLARLGFAVARELDPAAPEVPGINEGLRSLAARIASALKSAQRPLVVSGTSGSSEALIRAAANVSRALHALKLPASLSLIAHECNSFGLAAMDAGSLAQAMALGGKGRLSAVVLENDLYRRASRPDVDAFLGSLETLVAIDHIQNATTDRAAVRLPAGTFAESDGTLVSCEGRAQRHFQVFAPHDPIRESWRWLRDAMVQARRLPPDAWQTLDDVLRDMSSALPNLAAAQSAAPPAAFRMDGARIPRAPHRHSGRTAVLANITVHEPPPAPDLDSPLSFSMEGTAQQPPAALTPIFWAPGWNSNQSLNRFQEEIEGPLRGGDAGVRLIEPGNQAPEEYFDGIPPAFEPREDEWLIVPLPHIFGWEELSVLAPSIAGMVPEAAVALSVRDALRMRVDEHDIVEIRFEDESFRVPVRLSSAMEIGIAGFTGLSRPVRGTIARVS